MASSSVGFHPSDVALHVALPIGVSFFTFESMSYVIDVYRRDIRLHPSPLSTSRSSRSSRISSRGPIVRPRDLHPAIRARSGSVGRGRARESSTLSRAIGLLKKIAISDYLSVNLVDRVFDAPGQFSAIECYAAVIGYAVQIYCDFSGYTDIAIGSAQLLGIRFPKNFDAPYKAASIQDFWRRWHISLSTWLRDYIYFPLGGSRKANCVRRSI